MGKKKRTSINPINETDNKCFQDAITVELNMKKQDNILKESQKLNLLKINISSKEQMLHYKKKKIRKTLRKIM